MGFDRIQGVEANIPSPQAGDANKVLQVPGSEDGYSLWDILGSANEFTKAQNFDAQTVASSGNAVSWDVESAQVVKHTMSENTTITPSNMVDGGFYCLIIQQDAGGSGYTVSWSSEFQFAGGTAPTLSTAADAVDILVFESDGTNLRCTGYQLNVS